MKLIFSILFICSLSAFRIPNETVGKVDLNHYAGTWYSLYSIPSVYDKGSRETTGKYSWNGKGGYYDVITSYKKPGSEEVHAISSRVYQVPGTNNAKMKAQFVWPFKIDYWIIELAADYSYVVVGHPEHKFLFIMSRKKSIDKKLYNDIVARCEAKGYDVSRLACQNHKE